MSSERGVGLVDALLLAVAGQHQGVAVTLLGGLHALDQCIGGGTILGGHALRQCGGRQAGQEKNGQQPAAGGTRRECGEAGTSGLLRQGRAAG